MSYKRNLFVIVVIATIGLGAYAVFNVAQKTNVAFEKISVVATLFPQYDFVKTIGGDKVYVTLLLPPGIEAHSYEPKPSDIAKINKANIFIYTGEFMEPWAHKIVDSIVKKVKVVNASFGIEMIKKENEEQRKEKENDHNIIDPHIWLDFDNAKTMAENITKALVEVDPENAEYYQNNLKAYKAELTDLDSAYKNILSSCKTKTIISGGHYAFGYIAKRYELEYTAAQGLSPDSEPTAKDLIALIEKIKRNKIKYIFYEELNSPKIAETLANETGVRLLFLNAAHNISKEDYEKGKSFISIMKENLKNLSIGLDCDN